MDIKYPNVHVQLTGEDGNAVHILGRVINAMRRYGVDDAEINNFTSEATDGNYNQLLQTVMKWVDTS